MSSIIKLNLLAMVLLFNGCGHKAPIRVLKYLKIIYNMTLFMNLLS